MMKKYLTAEVAKIIGIHPNTVRFYEKMGLIPKPERRANGYRIYTDIHIEQLKLARTALQVEVLQGGLRKKAIEIIKTSAVGEYEQAECFTQEYLHMLSTEQVNAEEAIEIVHKLLAEGDSFPGKESADYKYEQSENGLCLTRKETADYLQITIDTLRNWEMNGLLDVKRKQNGYRVYKDSDIMRLKIIRTLRCANYSLAAILRLLKEVSDNREADIRMAIDTPYENEDIISACDKLLSSLQNAKKNALEIQTHIEEMQKLKNQK